LSSSSDKNGNGGDDNDNNDWKHDLLIFLQSLKKIWDQSQTIEAMPTTNSLGDYGAINWLLQQNRESAMIDYNRSIRDVTWLQEHGRCMDNIIDGIITVPYAGRGAFAR